LTSARPTLKQKILEVTGMTGAVPAALLADLYAAGMPDEDWQAVQATPAMRAQLRAFARTGGRVERVEADFTGANGMPGLIRFYGPAQPRALPGATFGTLAHELGHALFCPEQWRPPTDFADAHAYARSRELGEAHAWLNQYRLCQARVGGQADTTQWLRIENDHDFGMQQIDIFARIAEREAAGWTEAAILDELAMLNANMFPCGMGEGNHKTYGQCNRWDWLHATAQQHPGFNDFLQRLGRPPNAADQKLITKFNVFTPAQRADVGSAVSHATVCTLAEQLSSHATRPSLDELYALGLHLLPGCELGVRYLRS
jgi:hypothetical protein